MKKNPRKVKNEGKKVLDRRFNIISFKLVSWRYFNKIIWRIIYSADRKAKNPTDHITILGKLCNIFTPPSTNLLVSLQKLVVKYAVFLFVVANFWDVWWLECPCSSSWSSHITFRGCSWQGRRRRTSRFESSLRA